jgi:hypothetical protein
VIVGVSQLRWMFPPWPPQAHQARDSPPNFTPLSPSATLHWSLPFSPGPNEPYPTPQYGSSSETILEVQSQSPKRQMVLELWPLTEVFKHYLITDKIEIGACRSSCEIYVLRSLCEAASKGNRSLGLCDAVI